MKSTFHISVEKRLKVGVLGSNYGVNEMSVLRQLEPLWSRYSFMIKVDI